MGFLPEAMICAIITLKEEQGLSDVYKVVVVAGLCKCDS